MKKKKRNTGKKRRNKGKKKSLTWLWITLTLLVVFSAVAWLLYQIQTMPKEKDLPALSLGDIEIVEPIQDGEKTEPKKDSVGLAFTSNGDGTCYVSGIGTCTINKRGDRNEIC